MSIKFFDFSMINYTDFVTREKPHPQKGSGLKWTWRDFNPQNAQLFTLEKTGCSLR
jgi:hypothetical protein